MYSEATKDRKEATAWFSRFSINQSINQFITRHSTEARGTMSPSQTEKECVKSVLENVNGWSSLTAQWKRVPESWCRDRETTSSNVDDIWLLSMTSGQERTTEIVYTFNLWAHRRSGLWTPHGTTEHHSRLYNYLAAETLMDCSPFETRWYTTSKFEVCKLTIGSGRVQILQDLSKHED